MLNQKMLKFAVYLLDCEILFIYCKQMKFTRFQPLKK